MTGDRFLVGVDGIGGHGEVRCYQVRSGGLELVASWGKNGRIVTPAGVPASFAVDGPYFYFSDKYGTFYKAELATGNVVWGRSFGAIPARRWLKLGPYFSLEEVYEAGFEEVSVDGRWLFVNSSPAVSDNLVYFTVRTIDRRPRDWSQGMLLALNKHDGSVAWAGLLPGVGNTCPLVWPYAMRVLVGDRGGNVTCWFDDTGVPAGLSVWGEYGPVAVWANDRPLPDEYRWGQLGGAGVEPTLAEGYLILGVNEEDQEGHPTGMLYLLRMEPPVDLALDQASVSPVPAEAGRQVTVKARVTLPLGDSEVWSWVGWRWKGESEWRKAADVTLSGSERERWVSFEVAAPA
ncbi:MAG: hypothetical protein AB1816_20605, partial [Bacillota bacterium]